VTFDDKRNASVNVIDAAAPGGRRKVDVKVGVGNGTRIQVLQGLKAGDRVVLPG
jgi:multidrug efflux pump subunit AcrA (membrane-fusion protein)